jgi:hypothetical protein
MTEWSPIVRRAWGVLAIPAEDELASFPVDLSFFGRPVRLAVDQHGHRHVMVPSGSDQVAPDQRQHVLAMRQGSYAFDSTTTTYLDISCGDNDLNDEFDDVVLDVLESIDGSAAPASSAALTIGRWRRLFRAGVRRSLSEQQRLGLYAELTLLREFLSVDADLSPSVWTGPDRQPHDFELDGGCVEAKGLGRTSPSITVHGLDQLDTHDDKSLHLALVTVVVDDSGNTINELVHQLKETFVDGAGFVAQLGKSGWTADDPLTAATPYAVESISVHQVNATTPRLVRGSLKADLPEGIDDVRYAVAVPELLSGSDTTTFAELVAKVLA